MTKIEQFKKAKAVFDQIKRAADRVLGRDEPRNDKHCFSATFTGLDNGDWSDMRFRIHATYGYFGSSSGYSGTSEELGEYVAKAISANAAVLLDHAVKLAAADCEAARKAAEDEAKAVLQDTAA